MFWEKNKNPSVKFFTLPGNFENVLKGICGETTPKLTDIKCIYSTKNSIKYCDNLDDGWLNQFEKVKPDLFVYDEFNINEDILHYCDDNNIKTVHIKENLDFESILDLISFNYIPDLKHIILFYHLKDIRELAGIKNHFYSIDYPYKHLKLITVEENLFLPDTVLESDLNNIEIKNNYFFCFADLNLNPDLIKKIFT